MSKVTILLNDLAQEVDSGSTLQGIIEKFDLPELGCVFSINNSVVPKSEWGKTVLSDGDSISLFQAIAGG
ncbi:sulfur carrier protein ThiS [Vibrio sonorensis]|uniref:sulfur carrier protein ThiS n=1 Tax=Vibrio sonorensis TaxID=1004316 RepID=UPI000A059DEC|nr:sulfur carrier protein ThiS [Vibrio sonorensis]